MKIISEHEVSKPECPNKLTPEKDGTWNEPLFDQRDWKDEMKNSDRLWREDRERNTR